MRLMSVPTEEVEQIALVRWASYQNFYPYFFAIPNGGYRNKVTAVRLKAQGVRAGVSDLMLALPSKGKHGLFLEMKRRDRSKSRVSGEQKMFLEQQEAVGYETRVAYGWEHGVEIIENYLGIKR